VWGKEIATMVERVTGKKVAVSTTFGGAIGGIAWMWQVANAGEAEEFVVKLNSNKEYLSALAKAQTMFVPGSGHDQMWRQV
jgi:hypothetical protein